MVVGCGSGGDGVRVKGANLRTLIKILNKMYHRGTKTQRHKDTKTQKDIKKILKKQGTKNKTRKHGENIKYKNFLNIFSVFLIFQ